MQLSWSFNRPLCRVTVLNVAGGWVCTPGPIVSKFCCTSNAARFPIVASELGSSKVNKLLLKLISCSLEAWLIVGGILPLIPLWSNNTCNKLVATPMLDGIYPVRSLDPKFNSCSNGSAIRTGGMEPDSEFVTKISLVKAFSVPSTVGMVPVRPV